MEELAKKLKTEIDHICIEYHYFKQMNTMEKSVKLAEELQQFTGVFLQGNIFGMEEEEYTGLQNYVLQVLRDYTEAVSCQDVVFMIDTLDYGVRDLLNIFIDEEAEEDTNE